MNFFPFLHFFNFVVFVYMSVYILMKNPKALVNRICVGLFLCFAFWSFSLTFIHSPYTSKALVFTIDRIGALGWASFSSFFLWFTLAFTGKKNILKKKWLYVLLWGIPVLFMFINWNHLLFPDFIKKYYGWKSQHSHSIWIYLFYVNYLTFMGTGLFLINNSRRKSQNLIQKKQASVIFTTTMTALVLGSSTDVVFPILRFDMIPNIADSFVLILVLGIVYAMVKYKFLAITPAAAANDIISTMSDCLILLDPEGNIVTANKATLETLAYEQKQLNNVPASILFTAAEINRGIVEEITGEGNFKNKESTFKTREGKEVPILFSKSVLKDNSETPGGIVCVAKDISERKKLEEEILKTEKLESIGILAGGIAHDFNNLLSVMMGNISLAQLEVSPQDKIYKFLSDLEKAALKAGELTGKFITFSRGGWLKKEQLTLSLLLKNVMASEPMLQVKTISYHIDIPDHLLPIHGDKRQLSQVILNLLLNAVEAIPGEEGGRIAVSAENTSITTENQFQLKPGEYVKVSIEDNGTGIPAEIMDKVFDPYFSTKEKNAQKGMGLGLALCYSIIKKHEGHIHLESEPGKGTTVFIYLPAFSNNN
jgi:PAS domain S-box-containing protein